MNIRTRFAPSPTGLLHIGGLRTALYAYAFAKSQGGEFILRIEDTNRNRLVEGAAEKIYEVLKKFGLSWDEGPLVGGPYEPYVQSERVKLGVYQKYADLLVGEGHAYYCFCESQDLEEIKEEHTRGVIKTRDVCRGLTLAQVKQKLSEGKKPALRLKVPDNEIIKFFDFAIKKEIEWKSKDVDEAMLLKSDGFPTYHLAAIVDDFEMNISHVIRGWGWLPSTPVHLLIIKYLNFSLPEIGHLTDILDPEGGKLSKRKGSVSCEEMLAEGYLPEAILNFIMLLGWAPKDNREIFSLPEFVDNFQKGSLQIANPVFNRKKLDWFNGYYIRQLSVDELRSKFKDQSFDPAQDRSSKFAGLDVEKQKAITKLVRERITKLSDLNSLAGFLFERPNVDVSLFGDLAYREHLSEAVSNLSNLTNWTNDEIQTSLTTLISKEGWKTGDFYMSFRIALSGSKFTPPITKSAEILGKKETIFRLKETVKVG